MLLTTIFYFTAGVIVGGAVVGYVLSFMVWRAGKKLEIMTLERVVSLLDGEIRDGATLLAAAALVRASLAEMRVNYRGWWDRK